MKFSVLSCVVFAKDLARSRHDTIISAWILKRGNLDYAETSGKNSQ